MSDNGEPAKASIKTLSDRLRTAHAAFAGLDGVENDDLVAVLDAAAALSATPSLIEDVAPSEAEIEDARQEGYNEGYEEGKSEWRGVKAQLWNAMQHWLTLRHGMQEDGDDGGYTVNALLDGLAEVEAENKRLLLASRRVRPSPVDEDARDGVAARDVLAERERQKTVEGWTAERDDLHQAGEISYAAMAYIANSAVASQMLLSGMTPENVAERAASCPVNDLWPWDSKWWKPTGQRRDLVKAGALILAEIERIDRSLQSQRKG